MIKTCTVDGCKNKHCARGLCRQHYYSALFHEDMRPRVKQPETIPFTDIPRHQQAYTMNYENISLSKKLQQVLHTLTAREYMVVSFRYGLNGESEHTLEETGHELDVTRERIRQIEAQAFRKLRHPSRSKYLKPFVSGEEVPPQPHIQYAGNEDCTGGSFHQTCMANQGREGSLESSQR
jgi:hypothetical protein